METPTLWAIRKKYVNPKIMGNKKTIWKPQQKFRSEAQKVFTEKVNKIAHGINDDKRIKLPDGVISIWCRSWKCVQKRIDDRSKNKKLNIFSNFDEVFLIYHIIMQKY